MGGEVTQTPSEEIGEVTQRPEREETPAETSTGGEQQSAVEEEGQPEASNDENQFEMPAEVTRDENTGVPVISGGEEADRQQEEANQNEIDYGSLTTEEQNDIIDDILNSMS